MLLFWCSSISWEPINCFTLFFCKYSWYYLEGYLIKETFLQRLFLCWVPFWGILGVCSSIFESCFPSYPMSVYTGVFCITLTVNLLRKISQHLFLYWEPLGNIFGSILGVLPNILRNVKQSLDNLYEWLDITAVVTKLRNVLDLALLWIFLGAFDLFCTTFLK